MTHCEHCLEEITQTRYGWASTNLNSLNCPTNPDADTHSPAPYVQSKFDDQHFTEVTDPDVLARAAKVLDAIRQANAEEVEAGR